MMGWIAEFLGLSVTLAIGAGLTATLWLWGHNTGTRLAPTLENEAISEASGSNVPVKK
jgi:hypothetical protein